MNSSRQGKAYQMAFSSTMQAADFALICGDWGQRITVGTQTNILAVVGDLSESDELKIAGYTENATLQVMCLSADVTVAPVPGVLVTLASGSAYRCIKPIRLTNSPILRMDCEGVGA